MLYFEFTSALTPIRLMYFIEDLNIPNIVILDLFKKNSSTPCWLEEKSTGVYAIKLDYNFNASTPVDHNRNLTKLNLMLDLKEVLNGTDLKIIKK
jgi:hypothetical protein